MSRRAELLFHSERCRVERRLGHRWGVIAGAWGQRGPAEVGVHDHPRRVEHPLQGRAQPDDGALHEVDVIDDPAEQFRAALGQRRVPPTRRVDRPPEVAGSHTSRRRSSETVAAKTVTAARVSV
jgi:hypothetical protein